MARLFEVRTMVDAENAEQAVKLARQERVFYVTDPHHHDGGEQVVVQEPPTAEDQLQKMIKGGK